MTTYRRAGLCIFIGLLLCACGDGDPDHDVGPPFGPPTAAIPAAPSASQSL